MSNYKRSFLALIFGSFLLCFFQAQAQKAEETKYYPYWHERASLFKLLPNTKNEIILLGDSITDGCEWNEIFEDPRIKNRGIGGDTTDGVIDRLDEVVESHPSKIFLMIGVNDLAQGKTVDQVVSNIKRIIQIIQEKTAKTKIYLEGILRVNPDFDLNKDHTNKTAEIISVNNSLKQIEQASGNTYVDLYSLFKTEDNKLNPDYTNDGLHLMGKAYLLWKSEIEKYLR